jgi:hypothetical protein
MDRIALRLVAIGSCCFTHRTAKIFKESLSFNN